MNFDLVIVGAGIVGTLSAYYALQRNPELRVLLIDKGLAGGGATHYSIGLDHHYGLTVAKKEMTQESLLCWEQLNPLLSKQRFKLRLDGVVSKANINRVRDGIVGVGLEPTELTNIPHQYIPSLGDDQVYLQGGYCEYSNTRAVVTRLIEHIKHQYHCSVWEGIKVEDIKPVSTSFTLSLNNNMTITTDKLLLAMGPWAVENSGLGLFSQLNLRTKKIISLHVERPVAIAEPALFFFDDDAFLMPMFDLQRWIFSFTVLSWDCLPDSNLFCMTDDEKKLGFSVLRKYLPQLERHCVGGRVFCDAYSDDWNPVVQPHTDYPGAVIATAGCGSGFRLAPSMANRSLDFLGV